MRDSGEPPSTPSGVELAAMGLFLAACVVLPLLGGLWVDGRLHSSPAGVLLGLLLGIVAACLAVYQRFRRYL